MTPERIALARMRAQHVGSAALEHPAEALRSLVAVQAQEFAYAKWSLAQRTRRPSADVVARAIDDGAVLRTHVLRPTWHFVAREDMRWLMQLSGPRVNAGNARRCGELGLDAKTLARSNDVIARAVAEGPLTRRELVPILARARLSPDEHRMPYMLMRAELDTVICSGPVRGNQHTYAAFDGRVPPSPPRERDEALGHLAARFFATRGPATLRDFAWWSGMPMADARRGLDVARAALKGVEGDGRTYWMGERLRAQRARVPRIDLIQCYDELIISYSESRDVLHAGGIVFQVPRSLEGFSHVVLRDGTLWGHWRFERSRSSTDVAVRVPRGSAAEREALKRSLETMRRYLAG